MALLATPLLLGFLVHPSLLSARGYCMRQALSLLPWVPPSAHRLAFFLLGPLYLWQDRSFIPTFFRECLLRRKECPSRSGCLAESESSVSERTELQIGMCFSPCSFTHSGVSECFLNEQIILSM